MSFPVYFVKGKEKNKSVQSNCRSCDMAHHRVWEPSLQLCHVTSLQEQAAAARPKTGLEKYLVQAEVSPFFCKKGCFLSVGCWKQGGSGEDVQGVCVLVLGCFPQGWEGCSAGTCPVPRKAHAKCWTLEFWHLLKKGGKLAILTFFITVFAFYSHMLIKYEIKLISSPQRILDVVEFFFHL